MPSLHALHQLLAPLSCMPFTISGHCASWSVECSTGSSSSYRVSIYVLPRLSSACIALWTIGSIFSLFSSSGTPLFSSSISLAKQPFSCNKVDMSISWRSSKSFQLLSPSCMMCKSCVKGWSFSWTSSMLTYHVLKWCSEAIPCILSRAWVFCSTAKFFGPRVSLWFRLYRSMSRLFMQRIAFKVPGTCGLSGRFLYRR